MSKKVAITNEQIEIVVAGHASGERVGTIAIKAGLSAYRVKGLLKKKEVAEAVDWMRLTDTIPGKLDAILGTMSAVAASFDNADHRLCAIEEEVRKIRAANHRLKVENKNLRETRRDARRQLREAKAALWKVRGY